MRGQVLQPRLHGLRLRLAAPSHGHTLFVARSSLHGGQPCLLELLAMDDAVLPPSHRRTWRGNEVGVHLAAVAPDAYWLTWSDLLTDAPDTTTGFTPREGDANSWSAPTGESMGAWMGPTPAEATTPSNAGAPSRLNSRGSRLIGPAGFSEMPSTEEPGQPP